MEGEGMAELRAELLAGLTGTVVEVGPGNGLNFGHYPAQVSEVFAVEPEPYLRRLAVTAAAASPVTVVVHTATDPLATIAAAGFEIATVRRLDFPEHRVTLPASPHVLGTARAPG